MKATNIRHPPKHRNFEPRAHMADGDEEYACCWNSALSDVLVPGHGDYEQGEEDNIFAYNVTT